MSIVEFVAAVACLPIFFTGHLIARWEGGLLFGYYFAYAGYLILAAMQAGITRTFGVIMIVFVLPITAVTLALGVIRAVRQRDAEKSNGGNKSGEHFL